MFERYEIRLLKKRIEEPRKFIQVVSGPRHVGKTTLVRQLAKKLKIPVAYEVADALLGCNPDWISQVWETARIRMKASGNREYLLILDETQKVPGWKEQVKQNWDADTRNNINLKIILVGSWRQMVREGMASSLTGRFENITLAHWSFKEMHDAFGWDHDKYAWFGGYPGSAELIDDEERWKMYIKDSIEETSISKDILMLKRIDKPALLRNLFELSCHYSGEVLSYTKMLGQLHNAGNTTTLTHYLSLLGDTGLVTGLQKYAPLSFSSRSSIPKHQVYNNALVSSHSPHNFWSIMDDHPSWARIVESAVGAYLANEEMKKTISLYYWRQGNDEVPFVIERGGEIIGIEVRNIFYPNRKGLTAFQKKFGFKIITIDDKTLPWHEFIRIRPEELF